MIFHFLLVQSSALPLSLPKLCTPHLFSHLHSISLSLSLPLSLPSFPLSISPLSPSLLPCSPSLSCVLELADSHACLDHFALMSCSLQHRAAPCRASAPVRAETHAETGERPVSYSPHLSHHLSVTHCVCEKSPHSAQCNHPERRTPCLKLSKAHDVQRASLHTSVRGASFCVHLHLLA